MSKQSKVPSLSFSGANKSSWVKACIIVLVALNAPMVLGSQENDWRQTIKRISSQYSESSKSKNQQTAKRLDNTTPLKPEVGDTQTPLPLIPSRKEEAQLPSESEPFDAQLDLSITEASSQNSAEGSPTIAQQTVDLDNIRRFPAGEELILSLTAAESVRGEIFAIITESSYRLGLSELSELLDFPIDVGLDGRQADGWFISQNNAITLRIDDKGLLTADIAGTTKTLGESEYQIDGDILLDVETLEDWFGLTFELNETRLTLAVTSTRPFSFVSAEQRRQRSLSEGYSQSESVLPPLDNGYRLYSPPLVDAQVFVRAGETTTNYGYSITSGQDAAFLSSRLFIAGTKSDALADARLTLTKESPEGELLGPLQATEISFGDVLPINAGTGATAAFGRGISISNVGNQLGDNRIRNFTGLVQEGWDVELYRNGILLANEFNILSGRYEFTDIELLFGNNDFEIVLYGPQGQIERRTESYIVDNNALAENQSSFRFSVVDGNKTLLGVTITDEDPRTQGLNAGLVYDRGITDWYTLGIGTTVFDRDDGQTSVGVSLRNNISFGKIGLLNSVIQWNNDDQQSMLANFRTRISNTNVLLNVQQNRQIVDSEDPLNPSLERVNSSFGATLSGNLFQSFFPLSHETNWRRSWDNNGVSSENIRQSLSFNSRVGSFNHTIAGSRLSDDQSKGEWTIFGELGYRHRFNRLFTRLYTIFDYRPEQRLRTIGAAINYPFSNTLNSELSYAYDVQQQLERYNARINWQGEQYGISGIASYNNGGNWSVTLNARLSLGVDVSDGSVLMTSRSISQSGALGVTVFEDLDLDKQRDPDEPLLDDVKVEAAQVSRSDKTREGKAFLNRLPSNRSTDIVIDESTLPDPSYMRIDDGFSVTGRRGLLQFAEIPVVRGGELDGTVFFINKEGQEEPLPFIDLNLVNEEGEIIASTKSEFDGFYLFEKVIPGDYKLFIDERDVKKKNAIQEVTKQLNISNQGDLFTEVDIVLRELETAEGYIAEIGRFKSLTLLKVYFNLLQKRLPPGLLSNAFYLSPGEQNIYRLAIAYSDTEAKPAALCKQALTSELECQVSYVAFGY